MPQPYPRVRIMRDTTFCTKVLTERVTYETSRYNPVDGSEGTYEYPIRCLDMTLKKLINNSTTMIYIKLSYKENKSVIYDYFPSLNYIRYFEQDDDLVDAIYCDIRDAMSDWDIKWVEFLGFELEEEGANDE